MRLNTPGAAAALALAAAIFLSAALSSTALADGPVITGSATDTIVRLNGDGSGHVDQHMTITNVESSPIVVGTVTLDLLKNDALWSGLISPRDNYRNVTVTRDDGTPVEYNLTEQDGYEQLQIFSQDVLVTGWNSQFTVSYDVDDMVGDNLLTKEFGLSEGLDGTKAGDSRLTVVLPSGSHVTCASPGAVVQGSSVSWSGPAAGSVSLEYSGLPLPAAPVPLQYLFWGGLMVAAVVWCFKPRNLLWWRHDSQLANSDDRAGDNAAGGVPDRGDRLDGK